MNQPSAVRRIVVAALAALPLATLAQKPARVLVEVWKDPNCGCCQDWVKHLKQEGFAVKVHGGGNDAMRAKLGMPQKLASCHTGLVGGYAVEGHVPAADIRKLLKDKPEAIGLTVPGMPVGSPGMDQPIYGNRRDPYDVLLVTKTGDTRVYASYNKQAPRAAAAVADTARTEAEVRKVDRSAGKITLKHGEIKNLDMPPMTMVFGVRDQSLLDKVKAGDKITFTADREGGHYFVTSVEARR